MKVFKTERDWKDLERADKIVLFVGVLLWVLMSSGVYIQDRKALQLKQNVFKTEMVKHR